MDIRAFRRHLRKARQALTSKPLPRQPHVHPTYGEVELLRRAAEFNRNAELHWQRIAAEPAGRKHALNKPVSTVRDTASIFYRLGLVLQELDLGIGMTVVDFGSGSCWFSSLMNRMRCRTISVDVSPTALEFGRQMFDADPRHHLEADPLFLVYAGHEIGLPDESVDRIVCFDSFHHVPNQEEVLREFFRILRPGGRVVMGEPGEGHAHSDQSIFETEIHGVLENDIHLDELLPLAERVGFHSPRLKPFPDPASITFSPDQHQRFMAGDDEVYPLEALRKSLRHFIVLSLLKGPSVPDSRNPGVLRAEITPLGFAPGPGDEGTTLKVRVRNDGDTRWLHETTPLGGFVFLAAHTLDQEGRPVARGFTRVYLPHSVESGGSVDLEIRLPNLLPEGGNETRWFNRIQLDMVDEEVAWFEQCGSPKLILDQKFELPTSRDPLFLFATLALVTPCPGKRLGPLRVGELVEVTLMIANAGDTRWIAGPPGVRGSVVLGVEVCDEHGALLVRDHERFALPRDLNPTERIEFTFSCHAPATPGKHRLRFDLVNEGVHWFEHYGVRPVDLPIETVQGD